MIRQHKQVVIPNFCQLRIVTKKTKFVDIWTLSIEEVGLMKCYCEAKSFHLCLIINLSPLLCLLRTLRAILQQ